MITERAYIHHRDDNPLNNRLSNLMVLCAKCHRQLHKGTKRKRHEDGIYVLTIFSPSKRAEILAHYNSHCAKCNVTVSPKSYSVTKLVEQRCNWCGLVAKNKKDRVLWQDGRAMCKLCFEKWLDTVEQEQHLTASIK